MNCLAKTLGKSIRFRRWSRKRYAAFCSLGKIISIGHLRCAIAEQSLIKQCLSDRAWTTLPATDTDPRDHESDLPIELSPILSCFDLFYSKAMQSEMVFQPSRDMSCLYNYFLYIYKKRIRSVSYRIVFAFCI